MRNKISWKNINKHYFVTEVSNTLDLIPACGYNFSLSRGSRLLFSAQIVFAL
jgi:hypothetical protein